MDRIKLNGKLKNHSLLYLIVAGVIFPFFYYGCKSTDVADNRISETESIEKQENDLDKSITLLFGGDIMAHTQNYNISEYKKIWNDVEDIIQPADLAFANIEAPIDTTKKASSWPNFNMTYNYVKAAINAGFDVFSLCNNHTNDQYLTGIKETQKTTANYIEEFKEKHNEVYFSGLKNSSKDDYSYNLIEKNGWKILFLPITELLNRPDYSEYINFVRPDSTSRSRFIEYCNNLRKENPCDLFILSVHTSEPEYTRVITEKQNQYYMDLLEAGVDILWANHAHIIKDRKIVYNSKTGKQKVIMYANGNTISGQRTAPALTSQNPIGERDNTGDGLLYEITFTKNNDSIPEITNVVPHFITTYINTANEFIIKKLNQNFVNYLYEVSRKDWAEYIKRRIKINDEATKDIKIWQ